MITVQSKIHELIFERLINPPDRGHLRTETGPTVVSHTSPPKRYEGNGLRPDFDRKMSLDGEVCITDHHSANAHWHDGPTAPWLALWK